MVAGAFSGCKNSLYLGAAAGKPGWELFYLRSATVEGSGIARGERIRLAPRSKRVKGVERRASWQGRVCPREQCSATKCSAGRCALLRAASSATSSAAHRGVLAGLWGGVHACRWAAICNKI